MKIALIFASTEGQTRKIALFVMDRLVELGHSVALLPAADAGTLSPDAYDRVILAASVHVGKYQSEMIEFVKSQAEALRQMDTLFLSVSLAAASDDPEDRAQLEQIDHAFGEETGVSPGRVEHIAGAFRFSDYNFFQYWAMRWIESKNDPREISGTDREYTDWDALAGVLSEWAGPGTT